MESGIVTVIVAILGALGGGGIVSAIAKYRSHKRTQDIKDTGDVNTFLNDRFSFAVAEMSKIVARLNTLERTILDIQKTHYEQPMPTWTKNMFGQHTWYNDSAARMIFAKIGKKNDDIIGKTDEEVWGVELANILKTLDKQALLAPDRRARKSGVKLHPDLPMFTIYTNITDTSDSAQPIAYTGVAIDEIHE